jgi:hypothetical protein
MERSPVLADWIARQQIEAGEGIGPLDGQGEGESCPGVGRISQVGHREPLEVAVGSLGWG